MARKRRRWTLRIILLITAVIWGFSMFDGPDIEPGSTLVLNVSGEYVEGRPANPLLTSLDKRRLLSRLLGNLKKARFDSRVNTIVLRIRAFEAGWAQAKEIRDAVVAAKTAGKSVYALLEGELDGMSKELYLASAAGRVYLPQGAAPLLNGLNARFVFLGGLWEKLDVGVEVEQIREFKSMGDMISRDSMSDAHRAMANWLLDGINNHLMATIADARNLTLAEMQAVIDSCPASPNDLVDAGLVDGIRSYEEVLDEAGRGTRPVVLKASEYAAVEASSLGIGGGPKVALIHASGAISSGGASGVGGSGVGSYTLSRALDAAADDDDIRAIVLRIDSPGGSATGSDEIWQAARAAAEVKPVVASLGNVAASGGYYIAVGADHIVAEPTTLTGSIGVVLVKPDFGRVLESMGITVENIGRGRFARLMDSTKPFSGAELAIVRSRMEGIYDLFLRRVAETRPMETAQVDAVGEGRVWTGTQAYERGLVDELGGLDDAIRAAATAAKISNADKVELVHFPKSDSIVDELLSMGIRAAADNMLVQSPTLRSLLKTPLEAAALEPGIHALWPVGIQID